SESGSTVRVRRDRVDLRVRRERVCEFADPYLEQLVAEALGLDSGPVPTALALQITQLWDSVSNPDVEGEHPDDLAGIECVAQLTSLTLPKGDIDALDPLTASPSWSISRSGGTTSATSPRSPRSRA
ncbi:MAG: hypothetical protein HC927_06020, partial [Deltaproteobacteria bacterium]|nr:hypothetical protein [Deltaproteobacteria bacterium]